MRAGCRNAHHGASQAVLRAKRAPSSFLYFRRLQWLAELPRACFRLHFASGRRRQCHGRELPAFSCYLQACNPSGDVIAPVSLPAADMNRQAVASADRYKLTKRNGSLI